MWKYRVLWGMAALALLLGGCRTEPPGDSRVVQVRFQRESASDIQSSARSNERALSLAVSAMISPKETYDSYESLVEYLSRRLGVPIHFKQRKTYAEVNRLLATGQVDVAFICSGAYMEAVSRFPLEILAVPVVAGRPYYHAYVIVHRDANFREFADFRGRSFAFTDPLSNTGYYYAMRRVRELGEDPADFFSRTIFTYAHDHSIQAVARKIVDGASVDGLIFDYLKEKSPERVAAVKILEKSELFAIPPVVASPQAPPSLKRRLRHIFLHMHEDEEGRRILASLRIDRFAEGSVVDYGTVRRNFAVSQQ